MKQSVGKKLTSVQESIINLIMDKPNITQPQMANMLNITERTIRNHLKYLIDNSYIKRVGSKKTGKWVINRGLGGKKSER